MDTPRSGNSPSAFRAEAVSQVFEWLRLGESGAIIGMSNVGKSALFQHLLDPRVEEDHLFEEAQNYTFVRLNLNNLPDFKNRSVYSLILDQLEVQEGSGLKEATLKTVSENHDLLLDSGDDELKIQRYFKLAVRAFLQDTPGRLVFLFDQFDLLYHYGQNSLFYNLRGLHDTYPNRIIYLVFTRQPLNELPVEPPRRRKPPAKEGDGDGLEDRRGEDGSRLAREELYELLQTNRYYLKPYTEADSENILRSIARKNHQPFDETLAKRLYALTRGHAGLLCNCYLYAIRNGVDIFLEENRLADILAVEMIAEECEKIWACLSEEEQIALAAQVRKLPIHYSDVNAENRLEAKGLICRPPASMNPQGLARQFLIFSPLFEQYTREQKTIIDRPVYIDWKSRTVYVFGKPSDELSKTEYIVLKTLYDRENTVVTTDELFQLCYPDEAYDSGSLAAITQLMHRIRLKLHISEGDQLIQAKRKQGYMLHNRLEDSQEAI